MKRSYLIVLTVLAIAWCVPVRAETDSRARAILQDIQKGVDNANQIDTLRVRTDAILPSGSVGTAELASGAVTGAKLAASAVSIYDTNTATTVTSHSATSVGQLLLGHTDAATGAIWRASATGTNNWVKVFEFTLP